MIHDTCPPTEMSPQPPTPRCQQDDAQCQRPSELWEEGGCSDVAVGAKPKLSPHRAGDPDGGREEEAHLPTENCEEGAGIPYSILTATPARGT